jgi:hypothetical protein
MDSSFVQTSDGIFRVSKGSLERLANFEARIIVEKQYSDGTHEDVAFVLRTQLGTTECDLEMNAREFFGMRWLERLGAGAIVPAGFNNRELLRQAIQETSQGVKTDVIYKNTGWTKIGDAPAYCSSGGIIGGTGCVERTVELSGPLAAYALPQVPTIEIARSDVREALKVLGLAEAQTTYPLLAIVAKAVTGPSDFVLWLRGATHAGKSELAALCQRFFGKIMDARNLPQSWESTYNALLHAAFLAKDALLVIDDFCPKGTRQHDAELERKAEVLIRAVGNGQGRGRCHTDGSLRPIETPRGTILCTGEDLPSGTSLNARMLVIDVGPRRVRFELLTPLQKAAAEGVFSRSLAAYLNWLAQGRNLERARECEVAGRDRWRAQNAQSYGRTTDMLGTLDGAFQSWLCFAREIDAITELQQGRLAEGCERALMQLGKRNSEQLSTSDPVDHFLNTVSQALAAGRANLLGLDGQAPTEIWHACGWRIQDSGKHQCIRALGTNIGWLCERRQVAYLLPDVTIEVVRRLAMGSGRPFGLSARELAIRLKDRGLLATTDSDRNTYKKMVGRVRHATLAVPMPLIFEVVKADRPDAQETLER